MPLLRACSLLSVRTAAGAALPFKQFVIEQRVTIQEKWRQSLTCTVFCPELLNVLTHWGMPFEYAMLKGADVRIIANQKRLNVLPSC